MFLHKGMQGSVDWGEGKIPPQTLKLSPQISVN